MFQYLLVVASTLIYFRVFHWSDTERPRNDKTIQTDPWFPLHVIDLMITESESDSEDPLFFEMAPGALPEPNLKLPPLVRQSSHGLKGSQPML